MRAGGPGGVGVGLAGGGEGLGGSLARRRGGKGVRGVGQHLSALAKHHLGDRIDVDAGSPTLRSPLVVHVVVVSREALLERGPDRVGAAEEAPELLVRHLDQVVVGHDPLRIDAGAELISTKLAGRPHDPEGGDRNGEPAQAGFRSSGRSSGRAEHVCAPA